MSGFEYNIFEKRILALQMSEFYQLAMKLEIEHTDQNTWTIPEIKANTNVFIEKIRRVD
jgi:post-segregation antitoxin (ccd killing protein)